MTINDKKCYITDARHSSYFKLDDNNNLVAAQRQDDASIFWVSEARTRLGDGKKSRFYDIEEIQAQHDLTTSTDENGSMSKAATAPALFDTLQNNWEQHLKDLYFMSSHIEEYQSRLTLMLSDVDKEICDIHHFMEFNNPDDTKLLEAAKMLTERKQHRRQIKNEMEKTTLMRDTFMDRAFCSKVLQSLESMERMKKRIYTPRKLDELFATTITDTVA